MKLFYIFSVISILTLQIGCFDSKEYHLKKYYKNGTYAGIVASFETLEECLDEKNDAINDDREIGYTNSVFHCEKE